MKKRGILIMTTMVFCLSLFACSAQDKEQDTQPPQSAEVEHHDGWSLIY